MNYALTVSLSVRSRYKSIWVYPVAHDGEVCALSRTRRGPTPLVGTSMTIGLTVV